MQTLKKKIGNEIPSKKAAEPASSGAKEKKQSGFTEEQKKIFSHFFKKAHVTEKATQLHAQNQYTFIVHETTTKFQTKAAIEKLFAVTVENVRMITIPRKKRMRGRLEGWKKGLRKAVVRVKEGQTIDMQ
ncbi:MAG: 50S ribosomal protein L23 [bacterium]|nr:50S ribosomal protein L23 [bacterium]